MLPRQPWIVGVFILFLSQIGLGENNSNGLNTEDHTFEVAGGFLGITANLKAAIVISNNSLIEATVNPTIFQFNADIDYKRFWGQSLYTLAGIGYTESFYTSKDNVRSGFGPTIGIGNQWFIEQGFFIGCDWIGLTWPVIKNPWKQKEKSYSRNDIYGYAGRLYVGTSF